MRAPSTLTRRTIERSLRHASSVSSASASNRSARRNGYTPSMRTLRPRALAVKEPRASRE
jgi:hypothetical protein